MKTFDDSLPSSELHCIEPTRRLVNVGSITSQGGKNCKRYDGRSSAWYSPSQAIYVAGLMEQFAHSETSTISSLEIDDPFHEDYHDYNFELLGFASFGLMRQFQVPWLHPILDKPYDDYVDGYLPGAVEWGVSLQPNNGVQLNREEVSQALSFGETQLVVGILRRTEPDLDSLRFITYGHFDRDTGVRDFELPLHSIHLWEQEVKMLWRDFTGHRESAVTMVQTQPPDDTFSIHVIISLLEDPTMPSIALADLVEEEILVSRSTVRLPISVSKPMLFAALDLPLDRGDGAIWKCGGRIIGGHERTHTFFGQYHRVLLQTDDPVWLMQTSLAAASTAGGNGGSNDSGGSGSCDDSSDPSIDSSGSEFNPQTYEWYDELPYGLERVSTFLHGRHQPISDIYSLCSEDEFYHDLAWDWGIDQASIDSVINVVPPPPFAVQYNSWPFIVETVTDRLDKVHQKLAVIQIEYHQHEVNDHDTEYEYRVAVLPNFISRDNVLEECEALNYCKMMVSDRCLIWHNNEPWKLQEGDHALRDGDFLRVAIPPLEEAHENTTGCVFDSVGDAGRSDREISVGDYDPALTGSPIGSSEPSSLSQEESTDDHSPAIDWAEMVYNSEELRQVKFINFYGLYGDPIGHFCGAPLPFTHAGFRDLIDRKWPALRQVPYHLALVEPHNLDHYTGSLATVIVEYLDPLDPPHPGLCPLIEDTVILDTHGSQELIRQAVYHHRSITPNGLLHGFGKWCDPQKSHRCDIWINGKPLEDHTHNSLHRGDHVVIRIAPWSLRLPRGLFGKFGDALHFFHSALHHSAAGPIGPCIWSIYVDDEGPHPKEVRAPWMLLSSPWALYNYVLSLVNEDAETEICFVSSVSTHGRSAFVVKVQPTANNPIILSYQLSDASGMIASSMFGVSLPGASWTMPRLD